LHAMALANAPVAPVDASGQATTQYTLPVNSAPSPQVVATTGAPADPPAPVKGKSLKKAA
jgi:hypothetical protein